MADHMWGINWQKYHQDQYDLPHIEKMGYRSFTIYEWHWSNRDACHDLLAVARPDAIFLNRDHPLSEQKDEQWKSDPAQKGRNHADEWAQKVSEGRVHTPLDRTYFLGLNEPDSNHYQRQIDAYNEAFCRRLTEHGLRAAAYSFGVGHPSTVGSRPDTLPDWSWYDASAAAVLEGGHIAALHEYGAPEQGGYGWGYWCNRLMHCPYPFDVILDECGIDNGVVNAGELYGWAKYMQPDEYMLWLDGFQLGQAERAHMRMPKILSYNIFSYDHGRGDTKDWHSFDIRPLRSRLESYPWSVASVPETPDNSPHTIHLPQVTNGESSTEPEDWFHLENWFEEPKRGAVKASILNARSGPGLDYPVVRHLEKGSELVADVEVERTGHNWVRVGAEEWVAQEFVQWLGEPPAEDKWTRSRDFVRRWEGEFQDVDWDAGNWTGCKVGEGIKKGTNFGISACSYPDLDIRNLTQAQADEIHFRDRWVASGADQQPWPMCLLVYNAAVNFHPVTAKKWLAESGGNPLHYVALYLRGYLNSDAWPHAHDAWVKRVIDVALEASK